MIVLDTFIRRVERVSISLSRVLSLIGLTFMTPKAAYATSFQSRYRESYR